MHDQDLDRGDRRPSDRPLPLQHLRSGDAERPGLGASEADPAASGAGEASVPVVREEAPRIVTVEQARAELRRQNRARARAGRDTTKTLREIEAEKVRVEREAAAIEVRRAKAEAKAASKKASRAEQSKAAKARRKAADRERRHELARLQEQIDRRRAEVARAEAEKAAAREAKLAEEKRQREERRAAWAFARSPEGRALVAQRKRDRENDHNATIRAENDRETLLALYDHPATARFLRLVNATRWEPEVHLPAWLDAAEEIPDDLRSFALHVRAEFDPLHRVAMKIAAMGGDILGVIGRLYGLTRERIRQIEVDGLRHLRAMAEVKRLHVFTEIEPTTTYKIAERAA